MKRKVRPEEILFPLLGGSVFVILGIGVLIMGVTTKEYGMLIFALFSIFIGGLIAFAGATELKSYLALNFNGGKKKWICCKANITAICEDNMVQTAGGNRQYIECLATNPVTGILMSCTSDKVFEDLRAYELETVPVYVNPKNPEKYFVDIQGAIESKNAQNNILDLR